MKLVITLIALTAAAHAAPLYYVSTDHTGSQSQIDVNHTSSWLLSPDVDFDLGGARLVMKSGQKTSDTVTFSIYAGTNASGSLLASVTQTNAQFCSVSGNCSAFQIHLFPVVPVTLLAGQSYFATLTSAAPDTQTKAYFIKNGGFVIADINGAALPEPSMGGDETPEPGTWMMILSAAALFGISKLRRRTQSRRFRQAYARIM